MAQRVHDWGRTWELISQADHLGKRCASHTVQTVAALVGVISSFPWIVLGRQSLGLVFSYLSFGRVPDNAAALIGVGVLADRQVRTVRMGMRGIVVSDMVQSIVTHFLGLCLILSLLMWLLTNGHTLSQVPATHFTLPGPGSPLGPLYLRSLILTGAIGGWRRPDIFARLFTARSAATIKESAVQAAPVLMAFATALTLLGRGRSPGGTLHSTALPNAPVSTLSSRHRRPQDRPPHRACCSPGTLTTSLLST